VRKGYRVSKVSGVGGFASVGKGYRVSMVSGVGGLCVCGERGTECLWYWNVGTALVHP
jgi:hypothetical protein